ncbi:MAG: DUF2125 domain-containing protein [Pseudomonadota bacterium]
MRWIKRLCIFAAILAVLWSGLWYAASTVLNQQITAGLKRMEQQGTTLMCNNQSVGGFPFQIGPRCDAISAHIDGGARDVITGGAVNANALLLNPGAFAANLTAPVTLQVAGRTTAARWDSLEINGKITFDGGFDELTMRGDQVSLNSPAVQTTVQRLALRLAPNAEPDPKAHLELSMDSKALALTSAVVAINPIDVKIDARLLQSYQALIIAKQPWPIFARDGFQTQLENLTLRTADNGMLDVSGPLSVDDAGLISGTLQIAIANPTALVDWANTLPRGVQRVIAALTQSVTSLGKAQTIDGLKSKTIEVTVTRGVVKLGFFTLATLPPLRF